MSRVAIVFGLLLAGSPAAGADPVSDPQLQEIADALRQWRESLTSVYFRCELTFDKGTLEAEDPSAPPPGAEHIRELEWAWTDRSQLRYNRADKIAGEVRTRQLWTIDGDRAYSLDFADGPSDADDPRGVSIGPAPSGSSLILESIYGLWYSNRSEWLPDLMDAGQVTLSDPVVVDGVEFPVIRVERAPEIFMDVALDPRHGWLPRETKTQPGDSVFRHNVHEFRRLEPGIWFPWSGVMEGYVDGDVSFRHRWRMLEVKLSQSLPRSMFRPRIPDGAHVVDAFSGKAYFQGGVRPQRSLEARTPGAPTGQPVSGAPEYWRFQAAALLLIAACVFFAAAWYLRKPETGN